MRTVALVARAVFKESVRDRVPYSMVIFAVLLMAASYLIGQLTAGQDVKIIKDLGLAALSIFGLAIAVFIGIGLVAKEVERRSIFALLTKPVTRGQFIVGKYAGLVMTLVVNLAVMTLAYYAVLWYFDATTLESIKSAWPAPALDPRLLTAIVLIVAELMLVVALALFFSTFSSPLLSALLTLGMWVAGHFNSDLRHFETVVDTPMAAVAGRALCTTCCQTSRRSTSRPKPSTACRSPCRTLVTRCSTRRSISRCCLLAAHTIFRRRDFK